MCNQNNLKSLFILFLLSVSFLFVTCGRNDLSQRLPGIWEDQNKKSRIEFFSDGKLEANLLSEFPINVKIHLSGDEKELPANLIGRLKLEGNWKQINDTTVQIYLIPDSTNILSEVAIFTVTLNEFNSQPILVLFCSPLSPNQINFQFRTSRSVFQQWNESDLHNRGYIAPNMDVAGVRVGDLEDNLYMSFGSISSGQLNIGNGFTVQKIPQELKLNINTSQLKQSDKDGQLVFHSSDELFVKAAVKTDEGLLLVTMVEGKPIAYPLVSSDTSFSFVLTELFSKGKQIITKDMVRFDVTKLAFVH